MNSVMYSKISTLFSVTLNKYSLLCCAQKTITRNVAVSSQANYRYYRELIDFKERRMLLDRSKMPEDFKPRNIPVPREHLEKISLEVWSAIGQTDASNDETKVDKRSGENS